MNLLCSQASRQGKQSPEGIWYWPVIWGRVRADGSKTRASLSRSSPDFRVPPVSKEGHGASNATASLHSTAWQVFYANFSPIADGNPFIESGEWHHVDTHRPRPAQNRSGATASKQHKIIQIKHLQTKTTVSKKFIDQLVWVYEF